MSPRVHSVATTGCPKDSSGERGVEKWTSSCHGQNPRSGVLSACFCSRTAQEAIWSRTRKACGCCGVGVGVGVGGGKGAWRCWRWARQADRFQLQGPSLKDAPSQASRLGLRFVLLSAF